MNDISAEQQLTHQKVPLLRKIAFAMGQTGWSLAVFGFTELIYQFYLPPDNGKPMFKAFVYQGAVFKVFTIVGILSAVGYIISGPSKKLLFIPDIDKWEKWSQNINRLIEKVDYALIDATFFDAAEINNRPISEIPHPLVVESMDRFKSTPLKDKQKIHFIHFNHTNPLINNKSIATEKVIKAGFNITKKGNIFKL